MKAASLRALVIVAGAIGMALSGGMPAAFGASSTASSTVADGVTTPQATTNPQAIILEINGAIGPATSRYVVHGIESAQKAGSRLVILQLDTPGGLDSSMRDIIRAILASPLPVVSYVSPSGARAASAGTYILYASHIAAMAPATNLGAATPVAIGGDSQAPAPPQVPAAPQRHEEGGTDQRADKDKNDDAPAALPGSAMERKVVNDAVAYIRGLAELRGRNAEWAEQAVRGAASLSANA